MLSTNESTICKPLIENIPDVFEASGDAAVLPKSHMVHSGVKTPALRTGPGSGSHKSRLLLLGWECSRIDAGCRDLGFLGGFWVDITFFNYQLAEMLLKPSLGIHRGAFKIDLTGPLGALNWFHRGDALCQRVYGSMKNLLLIDHMLKMSLNKRVLIITVV